ncbi:MAG: hypothetical protein ACKOX7_07180 [Bacteroidota bacterium]
MTNPAIRLLEGSQINEVQWNKALEGSTNGNIYAYSWYLDAVSPGWCALVAGDYQSIMPLPIRNKYLVDYAFMPPYCQQLGVFSPKIVGSDILNSFLNAIPRQVRFVDLNLNAYNNDIPKELKSESKLNLILKLNRSIEDIRNGYSTNHKRNIRKFRDSGLVIEKQENPEEVIRLFESGRGGSLGRYPDKDHKIFRRLFAAVQENAHVHTLVARNEEGQSLGGAVFFETLGGSYFIFSGVSKQGREYAVMHGLVDYYLSEKSMAISFLDFEGSNIPELARFYAGFGADESVYLHIVMNRLPFPFCFLKPR